MTLTKTNYVLIDYENSQTIELGKVVDLPVKVVVFLGEAQKSVPAELLKQVCDNPGIVQIERSVGSGKNALDFQIACYAGILAERDPHAFIHFVSKDKGFDIMVPYLKAKKILSARADDFRSLFFLNHKDDHITQTLAQKIARVRDHLSKISKPRKLTTLTSSIQAIYMKQLPDADIPAIIDGLKQTSFLTIDQNGKVQYQKESDQ